jgi:acetyl esterase/lipase
MLPLPFEIKLARNIVQPTLTAYLPDPARATGTAVIVCPGGAFHFLAIEHEGTDVASWLCEHGIAAFVLKYRVLQTEVREEDLVRQLQEHFADVMYLASLVQPVTPLAIADARQAVRVVRQRAAEWGIVSERIGLLGFSSGGVVTIGAAMQYDAASRPNFAAPIYSAPLGIDIAVPADAPSLFLLVANDDPIAGTTLSLSSAWREAGHPVELHLYAQGGHGFGMRKQGLPSDHWIERLSDWLRAQGFPILLSAVPISHVSA